MDFNVGKTRFTFLFFFRYLLPIFRLIITLKLFWDNIIRFQDVLKIIICVQKLSLCISCVLVVASCAVH